MKRRYKRRKTSYLLIFVIVLLSISTGYAALNSTLIIMGTSVIQKNTGQKDLQRFSCTRSWHRQCFS